MEIANFITSNSFCCIENFKRVWIHYQNFWLMPRILLLPKRFSLIYPKLILKLATALQHERIGKVKLQVMD